MRGEPNSPTGVPDAERDWAEGIVDATHPRLSRLTRWPLIVARGATTGAVAATAVGAVLAPDRMVGTGLAALLLWLVPSLAALWMAGLIVRAATTTARSHLVTAVATEAAQRGRGAACLLALQLRPAGASPSNASGGVPLGIRPWGHRAERSGQTVEVVVRARGAGRRALSAMTALATLTWVPEMPLDASTEPGTAGGVERNVG